MSESTIDRLEYLRGELIQICNKINRVIWELKHQKDPRPLIQDAQQTQLDDVLAGVDSYQASHLYRLFPGQRQAVIAAMHHRGWYRVRREKGNFWMPPTV